MDKPKFTDPHTKVNALVQVSRRRYCRQCSKAGSMEGSSGDGTGGSVVTLLGLASPLAPLR